MNARNPWIDPQPGHRPNPAFRAHFLSPFPSIPACANPLLLRLRERLYVYTFIHRM